MIPPFDERGNLPPGIHKASWSEVEARFGTTPWRRSLLLGLRDALDLLDAAGCRTAYLDGSFVTSKAVPADFDACWAPQGMGPDALDPVLLDFSRAREAQKRRFRGELFPADMAADSSGLPYFDYFQRVRNAKDPKGIVAIDLGGPQ